MQKLSEQEGPVRPGQSPDVDIFCGTDWSEGVSLSYAAEQLDTETWSQLQEYERFDGDSIWKPINLDGYDFSYEKLRSKLDRFRW